MIFLSLKKENIVRLFYYDRCHFYRYLSLKTKHVSFKNILRQARRVKRMEETFIMLRLGEETEIQHAFS